MGSVAPVMKEDLSDAKNTTASATSLGSPTLPMACVFLECSRNCCEKVKSYISITEDAKIIRERVYSQLKWVVVKLC